MIINVTKEDLKIITKALYTCAVLCAKNKDTENKEKLENLASGFMINYNLDL